MIPKEIDFPVLKNDNILKAAKGLKPDRVPIWAMRQAGRYLPEFREVRAKHDFFTVCRTPELACQVTLQPLERMDLDAAIIFSDILVIPQALGLEVQMVPGKGPVFPEPLANPGDISRLKKDCDVMKELSYVYDAITLTRHKLEGRVPLIGFSGAPWTLMAYMVEGGSSSTFSKPRSWLYSHPTESKQLLDIVTIAVIDYLVQQVKSGAQMLQLFESHAGLLDKETFCEFSLPYLTRIVSEVKKKLRDCGVEPVPITVFAKNAYYALQELSKTEFDVISLDWTIDPKEARDLTNRKCLQGNLDPAALYGSTDSIKENVKKMMDKFGTMSYIANLGHGMHPDMNPEHLKAFVDAVHNYKN